MGAPTTSYFLIVVSRDAELIRSVRSATDRAGRHVVFMDSIGAAIEHVGVPVGGRTAVLADLEAAGLDILDFIRLAHRNREAAPVAVMYGERTEGLAAQAVQLGAACCFDRAASPECIARALDRLCAWPAPDEPNAKATPHASTCLHDLVTACGQSLRLVAARLRVQRHLTLQIQVEAEQAMVHMPPDDVAHVLIALVLNAVEALDGRDDGRIRLQSGLAGERAFLAVADNGPGLREDQMAHCFEPFVTSRVARGALGVGLTNARHDVRRYGGDIVLRSAVGAGTTALVEFPAALGPLTVARQSTQGISIWDRLLQSTPAVLRSSHA